MSFSVAVFHCIEFSVFNFLYDTNSGSNCSLIQWSISCFRTRGKSIGAVAVVKAVMLPGSVVDVVVVGGGGGN